jgi:glycosyltransferase involved in cell wall biosynthesis
MIPFAFRRLLRLAGEFDVIYCAGYQGIGLAALAAGWWLRRPVVLRSGNLGVLSGWNWNAPLERLNLDPNSGLVSWLKARVRRVYMRADAFVANCREIETEALDLGVPRSHVHYLPNAVDIERFRPPRAGERNAVRAGLGWPADAMVCLYVGRLSREKGVMELLEAWRDLRPAGWRLMLVGPDMTGSMMDAGPDARAYVSANQLGNCVTFHGASTDAAPLYRAADLYVLPSHYEAFSNSLIEAMGTGLPVVATRIGGNLDAIVDDENGLLAAPKDAGDLARQLTRALSDAALRTRLGTNARATVVANFNAATVFGRFRSLFAGYVPTGE